MTVRYIAFPTWGIPSPGVCACPKGAACGKRAGKHPAHGFAWKERATDDPTLLAAWKRLPRYQGCNWAWLTGPEAGFFVADFDTTEAWAQANELGLPDTPTVVTHRGYHCYFRYPDFEVRRSPFDGIDIKGHVGYVMAPGSKHVSGHIYEWAIGLSPEDAPLADAPGWMLDKLRLASAMPNEYDIGTGRVHIVTQGEVIEKGERNDTLAKLIAPWLRRYGLDEGALYAVLSAINGSSVSPPLDNAEIAAMAAQVGRYKTRSLALSEWLTMLWRLLEIHQASLPLPKTEFAVFVDAHLFRARKGESLEYRAGYRTLEYHCTMPWETIRDTSNNLVDKGWLSKVGWSRTEGTDWRIELDAVCADFFKLFDGDRFRNEFVYQPLGAIPLSLWSTTTVLKNHVLLYGRNLSLLRHLEDLKVDRLLYKAVPSWRFVSTNELAQAFDCTPKTIRAKVKRMHDLGLVEGGWGRWKLVTPIDQAFKFAAARDRQAERLAERRAGYGRQREDFRKPRETWAPPPRQELFRGVGIVDLETGQIIDPD